MMNSYETCYAQNILHVLGSNMTFTSRTPNNICWARSSWNLLLGTKSHWNIGSIFTLKYWIYMIIGP